MSGWIAFFKPDREVIRGVWAGFFLVCFGGLCMLIRSSWQSLDAAIGPSGCIQLSETRAAKTLRFTPWFVSPSEGDNDTGTVAGTSARQPIPFPSPNE